MVLRTPQKMRSWYPLNDTPLFSYPAISIRSFKWQRMMKSERLVRQLTGMVWAIFFLYIFMAVAAHHAITWADFNATTVWHFLGCVIILALFPLAVLPVMMTFREAHPAAGPVSLFYQEWASAFAGTGKSGAGRIVFFAEDAKKFCIEPSTFQNVPVQVVTVSFRRRYFFKRGDEQFVVRTEMEGGPEKMIAWARDRGIKVELSQPDDHRRS